MVELFIILLLISLNGLFALSELAIASARQPRLKALASENRPGARRALALAANPGRFLSAVQIGITLISIVNGAYSGETFGKDTGELVAAAGIPHNIAEPIGYGAVLLLVTYVSVIVGELVPKSVALRNPEIIACAVAPFMAEFARLAGPVVWFLDTSTKLIFRAMGQPTGRAVRVTEEELHTLIAEAETAGVIEEGERNMISGVMRLADRSVIGLMTPRKDVEWINLDQSDAEIRSCLPTVRHSLLPVGEGSADAMIGVLRIRELLNAALRGMPLSVRNYIHDAPIVPETTTALEVLQLLRGSDVPLALIHDEYGVFVGLVTPADVLQAIAGAFRSDLRDMKPRAILRDDGSWILDGTMPADEMADKLEITLPAKRSYATTAGFILSKLQRLPVVGEHFEYQGWRFEVVDLDGRRIDKVLAFRENSLSRRVG